MTSFTPNPTSELARVIVVDCYLLHSEIKSEWVINSLREARKYQMNPGYRAL